MKASKNREVCNVQGTCVRLIVTHVKEVDNGKEHHEVALASPELNHDLQQVAERQQCDSVLGNVVPITRKLLQLGEDLLAHLDLAKNGQSPDSPTGFSSESECSAEYYGSD